MVLAVAAWVPITALVLSVISLGGKVIGVFLYTPALSLAIDDPESDPPEPSRNHDYVQTPGVPRTGDEVRRYVRIRVRNRRYLPAAENVQLLAGFDPPDEFVRNGLDPRPLVWSSARTSDDVPVTSLDIGPGVYRHADVAVTSGVMQSEVRLERSEAHLVVHPLPTRGGGHIVTDLATVKVRLLVIATNYSARRYSATLEVEHDGSGPQRVWVTLDREGPASWTDRVWDRYDRARIARGLPTFGVRRAGNRSENRDRRPASHDR